MRAAGFEETLHSALLNLDRYRTLRCLGESADTVHTSFCHIPSDVRTAAAYAEQARRSSSLVDPGRTGSMIFNRSVTCSNTSPMDASG
jgi:hypothetical protein